MFTERGGREEGDRYGGEEREAISEACFSGKLILTSISPPAVAELDVFFVCVCMCVCVWGEGGGGC